MQSKGVSLIVFFLLITVCSYTLGGGGGGGGQPCVFLNPVGFKHAIVTVEFLACTVVAQM